MHRHFGLTRFVLRLESSVRAKMRLIVFITIIDDVR